MKCYTFLCHKSVSDSSRSVERAKGEVFPIPTTFGAFRPKILKKCSRWLLFLTQNMHKIHFRQELRSAPNPGSLTRFPQIP